MSYKLKILNGVLKLKTFSDVVLNMDLNCRRNKPMYLIFSYFTFS